MVENGKTLIPILEKNHDAILLAELGALLHDVDKVSYEYFLSDTKHHALKNYKIRVNGEKRGFRDYYYDHASVKDIKGKRWLDFFPEYNPKIKFEVDYLKLQSGDHDVKAICESMLSSAFVYHHHNDPGEFPFIGAIVQGGICGCDGIDSELDKLEENDGMKQEGIFKIDNPFGTFENDVTKKEATKQQLGIIAKCIEINPAGMEKISKIYRDFIGETRYPCNDVTLWAHSYSVATLAKATLAKILIEYAYLEEAGKLDTDKNRYLLPARTPGEGDNATDFTFLRIYFDRDYLLSRAQRTLDVMAVDSAIEELQKDLRNFVSTKLLIGNETYHDEEMQLFCIPRLATWQAKESVFGDLRVRFENEVESRCRTKIEEKLVAWGLHELPFEISTEKNKYDDNVSQRILKRSALLMNEQPDLRQSVEILEKVNTNAAIGHGRCEVCGIRFVEKKYGDDWLCEICIKRRNNAHQERIGDNAGQEWFTHELSECLPEDDRKEGENKLVLISLRFDISSIRDGGIFDMTTMKKLASDIIENKKKQEKPKNPSPGRLYRCWETLREFSGSLFEETKDGEGKKPAPILTLNGGRPVFRIIQSPKSLQFVASARHAAEIIDYLHNEYERRFGKFRAVLPMSIGSVFFHDKFPLYVVLEAAKLLRGSLAVSDVVTKTVEEVWRVALSPEETNGGAICTIELTPASIGAFGSAAGPVQWRIPRLLSDNKRRDDFHPFFRLANNSIKHVDALAENDELLVRDGRFDFIFLDAAVRRFDILPKRIRHHVYGERPSYPLSAWRNFQRLGALVSRLSDTQVKHIERALTDKMRAWRRMWQIDSTPKPWENAIIKQFCVTVLFSPNAFGAKRFLDGPKALRNDDRALLTAAAVNGMLLDAIDLYVRLTGEPERTKTDLSST